MCGITGFVDFTRNSTAESLRSMVCTLNHRGPDDKGTEVVETDYAKVGMGQSRLSIIDLSEGGHQPMRLGQLVIVYNGEIYNFQEIKEKLTQLGHSFQSNSDTEVILHAFQEWGDKAVHRFIGMFAFVIFDEDKLEVKCFRDRTGVKPFYYWFRDDLFLFGSELKALAEHPKFTKEVEEKVLPSYLQHGYIPSPYSIFKDCFKLEPGHYLTLDLTTKGLSKHIYWSVLDYYAQPKLDIRYKEAKDQLHELLVSAFQYRMVADVPVGVFLSGGYDSTAVTAILQAHSDSQLQTFTIGFEEGNNEAPYAKKTANFLGTKHTEYICTTSEAQEIIPQLPYFYDEPFGDSSAIPTTLVSRLARKTVTVALSADGGDEVFCGYNSYFRLNQLNNQLNRVPNSLKPAVSRLYPLIKAVKTGANPDLQHKAASAVESLNKDELKQLQLLFQRMNEKPQYYVASFFKHPVKSTPSPFAHNGVHFSDPLEVAMAVGYQSYLQNDILTKVDRATMSISLEGREPLLDHRIIEFAARLPLSFKYGGGNNGKKILKDIVHEYAPKEMMDRPKSGFSLPIYRWLRNDLSYLLDEYLSEEALEWSGVWNTEFVSKQVRDFRANKLHYSPLIWYLLMFQMWWKRWMM